MLLKSNCVYFRQKISILISEFCKVLFAFRHTSYYKNAKKQRTCNNRSLSGYRGHTTRFLMAKASPSRPIEYACPLSSTLPSFLSELDPH